MLLWFVVIYLAVSIGIGLYAATRVHNTRDYAVAGRSLPFYVVIATVFATWFGSETVLGIPAKFLEKGLAGVVEDPFGSSLCLVLVGLFFAAKLYKIDGNVFTVSIKPIIEKPDEKKVDEFGYSGEKLSLNFQNIDVRAALQVLADFTGLNFVISDTVRGSLTLRLKDVPWDQAMWRVR